MDEKTPSPSFYNRALVWLSACLPKPERPKRLALTLACAIIFVIALGVRLLHWQDIQVEVLQAQTIATTMATAYRAEAHRMLAEGGILLPHTATDPQDARMVLHPPGFSILMAAIYGPLGGSDTTLKLLQVAGDCAAAMLVFLIAAELLPMALAITSGLLVGLSPHLAYYSLWLSPDTLAALPILVAIYLIVRASRRPRLITVVAAGTFIGLSCWLRSNALLLAPFLAILVALLFEGGKRFRYCAALIGAAVLVISPITIRNLILYRHFIPLSVGAGITTVEGIADYDKEHRFGMPFTDEEVAQRDAEWHGRPDYAGNPWTPDGIERDRARQNRGLVVIRSNPGWFLGVMFRRAGFMLRSNDSGAHDWPFGTAAVPIVSDEATFSHDFASADQTQPVWSNSPVGLLAGETITSPRAEFSLVDDGKEMQLTGDSSDFGDQLASMPIAVRENTDYLLTIPIRLEQGHMAAKVTTPDLRVALASVIVPDSEEEERKRSKRKAKQTSAEAGGVGSTGERSMSIINLPFASGRRTEFRLVLSNNGATPVRTVALVGRADLFAMGPTRYSWARYPRKIIRGVQKNLFTTGHMLPLVIIGVALLAIAKRGRALALLLAVPVYYMCTQSALHTEYRYILAIHYFLFVMAAVTLGCFGVAMGQAARWTVKQLARPARKGSGADRLALL